MTHEEKQQIWDELKHVAGLWINSPPCWCKSHLTDDERPKPIEELCDRERLWLLYTSLRDKIVEKPKGPVKATIKEVLQDIVDDDD